MNVPGPLMRYPGSKFRIARWIISHFPPHEVYVEPFGGSAAVLFQKPSSKVEVYNDINEDVVNVFRVLRNPDQAARLAELIALTPYSRQEHNNLWKLSEDPVENARRFICRSTFNIAKGPFRKSGFDSRINTDFYVARLNFHNSLPKNIQHFAARLKNVIIEQRDYAKIIDQFDRSQTLFYLDPEYLETQAVYRSGWKNDDHTALAELLHTLKGGVIISGYDSSLYKDLFENKGWVKKRRKAYADGGHRRTECIWLNPKVHKLQFQPSLFK